VPRVYESLGAEQIRARAAALQRFSAWEREHPATLSAEVALAGIAWLYELLPLPARARPVDTSGVAAMHAALSVLRRAPA
jgi:hypothetical protein